MKLNILSIEDDRGTRITLSRIFAKLADGEITVEFAENCADGMKRAAERCWDLVLLDLNLPDSGSDWWRLIERVKLACRCPVIVLSGVNDRDGLTAEMCLRHGADDYFLKPAIASDPRTLVRVIFKRVLAEEGRRHIANLTESAKRSDAGLAKEPNVR